MYKTEFPLFTAKVTLGLERGYSKQNIDKEEVIKFIQKFQNNLIDERKIHLSLSMSESCIVMSGQVEPHLNLEFINYPKFPMKPHLLKSLIEELTEALMHKFEQNRVVITYHDGITMLEQSKEIDPRIKKIADENN